MAADIREEVIAQLGELSEDNLRALSRVLHRMREGRAIRRWSWAIGSLSEAEAEEMTRVIEEGCERVDPDTW